MNQLYAMIKHQLETVAANKKFYIFDYSGYRATQLGAMQAKPIVAFHIAKQKVDGTSDDLKDGEWPIDNGIIEVYAVPPAPVPLTEVQRAMLHDMDVEISAEIEEEEETYRDGIRKCIAALRYHHKRAETCSNGYAGSTLKEDTLKSINFLKEEQHRRHGAHHK